MRVLNLLSISCVFWFSLQLLSETFLILRRTERDMIKNEYLSSSKVPLLFLSDFDETWNFSTDFRKHSKSKLMEIRRVGAELFHADGRTDMTYLIAAFCNLANAPKNLFIVARLQYGGAQRGNSPRSAPLLVGRLHRLRYHGSGVGWYRCLSWLQHEVDTWQEKQTHTEWIWRILDGRWSDECRRCGSIDAGRVSAAHSPLYQITRLNT